MGRKFPDTEAGLVIKLPFFYPAAHDILKFSGIIRGGRPGCHFKMGINDIPHIPQHHGGTLLNTVRGCQIQFPALFHNSLCFPGTEGIFDLIAPDVGEANGGTHMNAIHYPLHTRVPVEGFQ